MLRGKNYLNHALKIKIEESSGKLGEFHNQEYSLF